MNYPDGVEIAISFRGFFYFLIFVFDDELRTAAIRSVKWFFCVKNMRQKSIL